MEADVVCHKSNVKYSFTSQNSKTHALFRQYFVTLRYVLIYNLEVSFNFHLTFLQLRPIYMVVGDPRTYHGVIKFVK